MDESRDTRQRLIDAARKLMATGGFDGTSIRAVTDAAGANLGAAGGPVVLANHPALVALQARTTDACRRSESRGLQRLWLVPC